ncbi:unnamed protein product [Amoebophrya sp. A25]|nr:unnamed protein product [Amoebophrya sp. A25]|eukprot:GSA25T00015520001.1
MIKKHGKEKEVELLKDLLQKAQAQASFSFTDLRSQSLTWKNEIGMASLSSCNHIKGLYFLQEEGLLFLSVAVFRL